MNRKAKVLLGLGLLAAAPASFAQYTLDLTGVGNGNVADGVYVSPYQGTVVGGGMNYSGYLICDDFNTESYLNTPWNATMTAANALSGGQKFGGVTFDGQTYTAQQAYNVAGWLANGLLMNLSNSTAQNNYAFAIWDLFDGQSTGGAGTAQLETAAFAAVTASNGYVANNVSVFTASPNKNQSQEFLMVRAAPEIDPATATSAMTLLLGGGLVLRGRRKRQG
ncbi:MAG TPA: hypothetical protein VHY75_14895 [Steroidobacteraceae bacterium]|nr:hypothetical protein [Steroidobacteraceae bacterium]